MYFKIQKNPNGVPIYLFRTPEELHAIGLTKPEIDTLSQQFKTGQCVVCINNSKHHRYFIQIPDTGNQNAVSEQIRKSGAKLWNNFLKTSRIAELNIQNLSVLEDAAYHLAEGITLSSYQFLKYKSEAKKCKNALAQINFDKQSISLKQLKRLQIITDAVFIMRHLINEPLSYLTAEKFAEEIAQIGKNGGFSVKTLSKAKIEQLGMGGILGVNRGSLLPPTFTIMEHRPTTPIRTKPVVLVGKGIVYDTGGLSLKPTPNSMDEMKSDMSGAALVATALYIAAMLELPIHLIGLVPATENRPGANAYAPGDVLKMYSGTTVEVLNTDAEGRLVLADALHYAKKYRPELVLDFATLTGSAARTLGNQGIIFMGNIDEAGKSFFKESGHRQHERLVELPLWEEYKEQLQSGIADLKNIGGPNAGVITAGKFLEHFTDYPWLHFDIAGVSFHNEDKDYYPKGATGYGLRMLADFLIHYSGLD